MKVLITGNMGYIGPVLVKHLKQTHPGIRIIGFDSGFFATSLMGTQVLPEVHLDAQHFGDVRRLPAEILEGVDAVVYLSAISNDPMGKAFEQVTEDINQMQAARIAEQARASGVKNFVFASSCSMYGSTEGEARTEDSPLNPLTAYARSKAGAEVALRNLAKESFVVTALRFATACGFSPRLRLDLVLNDFVASAISTGVIEILSDGSPWRPLIHVRDMSRAIDWAVSRKTENGGDFLAVNAGSNEWNFQIRDLGEAVAKVIPGTTVKVNENAEPDKRSYRVNFDKFADLAPQHLPVVGLEEAVRELHDGLVSAGFQDPNFRSSRFIRLVTLQNLKEKNYLGEDLFWN